MPWAAAGCATHDVRGFLKFGWEVSTQDSGRPGTLGDGTYAKKTCPEKFGNFGDGSLMELLNPDPTAPGSGVIHSAGL